MESRQPEETNDNISRATATAASNAAPASSSACATGGEIARSLVRVNALDRQRTGESSQDSLEFTNNLNDNNRQQHEEGRRRQRRRQNQDTSERPNCCSSSSSSEGEKTREGQQRKDERVIQVEVQVERQPRQRRQDEKGDRDQRERKNESNEIKVSSQRGVSSCWPKCNTSQVVSARTKVGASEQQVTGINLDRRGNSAQTKTHTSTPVKLKAVHRFLPGRSKRSDSLQVELDKIKMHEKLLVNDQKKLFAELNEELAGLSRPAHSAKGCHSPDVILDMATQRANDCDGGGGGGGAGQMTHAAIECKDLIYQAGLGPLQKTILHGVNLCVPEGSIYGLLGPSGCGKTTVLRSVAGRLTPSSGSVRVFGFEPNEPTSQIPGPAIGYMPQEVSIYEEFTIDETLTYFGRINRMRTSLLEARVNFLVNFLSLPQKSRPIRTLSGGQKRRVSLAVALIHSPPLLILDEPTVGVDPLLRQIIWKYLVTLATSDKITIVITTHYIEEARQANIVGLMRHGRLLAEDAPQRLMDQFQQVSLENVFLKLCLITNALGKGNLNDDDEDDGQIEVNETRRKRQDELMVADCRSSAAAALSLSCSPTSEQQQAPAQTHEEENERLPGEGNLLEIERGGASKRRQLTTSLSSVETKRQQQEPEQSDKLRLIINNNKTTIGDSKNEGKQLKSMERGQKYAAKRVTWASWFAILFAVTWKNYLRLRRNPPVVVFEFLLPAFQVVLFCLCIGGDPFDIPLAVVNEESTPQASRLFLSSISKETFRQIPYDNLSSAIESVERGHTWAVVHIPESYTKHLNERLLHPADITNETISNGTISVYPDLTNLHLALTIENAFRGAFEKFARETLDMFGYDTQLAELPIRVARPIYGSLEKTTSGYLEFMAPGVIISITYVMATGLTALAFVLEKRDGLLERSQVSGVTTSQILLAHALLQVFVMIFQIGLVLAVSFYVFQIPSRGPFALVVLLVLLQGCTGMAFGLLISAICSEENTAVMLLVGTFYINLILAGIIWPVEAMPKWLRVLSYAQPQTLPTESLRNILSRGWSIWEPSIGYGFLVTIGWLVVFLLGAGMCMRYIK